MRILILGGDGMLGHSLLAYFHRKFDVRCTLRQDLCHYEKYGLFSSQNAYPGVDVRSLGGLTEVIADFRPEVIVNCVGIVKQRSTAKESIPSIEINALFPHRLAVLCKGSGAKLVHFSTDCVFNGLKGNYLEGDYSDTADLYGRTKFLGEVHEDHCLTLRTSIIGRELALKKSLLEWFLGQKGSIKGFKNAIYTGFTTLEMARIIELLLLKFPAASGVYQVSSDPINKYDLLCLIRKKLGHEIEIIPDEDFYCDRSLDSSRFRKEFDYQPPSWESMIEELKSNI